MDACYSVRMSKPVRTRSPSLRTLVMGCPVARAFFITGDAWTQLIVREAFFGVQRFSDWQKRLNIPKAVLSQRLARLVKARVLELRTQSGKGHAEYHLTDKGLDLYGFAVMQSMWEGSYTRSRARSRYPLRLFDRHTGAAIVPVVLDRPHGSPIDPARVTYAIGPGLKRVPAPTSRRRRLAVEKSGRTVIERSIEIMGDYWTWALLSAAFLRVRRFDALTESLGIATNVLTDRLQRLLDEGILERRVYSEAPPRAEYRLTAAGKAFYPVILALHGWSERWLCDFDDPPLRLIDSVTGKRITPVVADQATGLPLDPHNVQWQMTDSPETRSGEPSAVRSGSTRTPA